ncbi:MAG: ATP-dependent sacrificial sulfur transferase LarE [Deltaproteobacteria bacterium]|nr:MAG: ATP-dependent sacrificial sulfur transferase LarE [Deltaproteobacteria bacterium]
MHAKLDRLRTLIADYRSALICFSGGVDSTFLLKVAVDVLGDRCHALTCVSETMAAAEVADARALGAELGLGDRHHIVHSHELDRPGFRANPVDRCAMCKTELMEHAEPLAAQHGLAAIALGTNVDDLGDHRPGIAAASSRGAVAPMVAAGLTKADIRALSRELGLRTWNKPQLACLSSRFPYGTEITPERLRQVDAFEQGLRALGFSQLRVRFHDTIGKVELLRDEMARAIDLRDDIVALGRRCGFTYVALDLAGFRSGALNEGALVTLRAGAPKAS